MNFHLYKKMILLAPALAFGGLAGCVTTQDYQERMDARAQENQRLLQEQGNKLIGRVEIIGEKISASVQPTRLPIAHPLASVSGATNAITFSTDLLGDVTLVGPGAGRIETGYAIVGDLLAIHRKREK